jgi:hypothetical protein
LDLKQIYEEGGKRIDKRTIIINSYTAGTAVRPSLGLGACRGRAPDELEVHEEAHGGLQHGYNEGARRQLAGGSDDAVVLRGQGQRSPQGRDISPAVQQQQM